MASSEIDALAADLLAVLPGLLTSLQRAVPVRDAAPTLTRGQLTALRYLAEWGSCSMAELAAGVGVTSPTMTSTVRLLLKNGLAERRHDEQDWRTVRVTPTPAGLAAQQRYEENSAVALTQCVRELAPDQRAMLMVSLPALRALAQRAEQLARHTGDRE